MVIMQLCSFDYPRIISSINFNPWNIFYSMVFLRQCFKTHLSLFSWSEVCYFLSNSYFVVTISRYVSAPLGVLQYALCSFWNISTYTSSKKRSWTSLVNIKIISTYPTCNWPLQPPLDLYWLCIDRHIVFQQRRHFESYHHEARTSPVNLNRCLHRVACKCLNINNFHPSGNQVN